tara:strand:+ start:155 stop:388 length:234 start_codon:yes stop_codon:yes gene_type:complete
MQYVFIGTINHFDFDRISTILTENKIQFFIKSAHHSSLQSGWMMPGTSFNEKILFVDNLKVRETKKILKQYIIDYSD